ncbi:hypothetical protein BS50DRAFT_639589 [Corynespora cassiicola Philippines]|uniref:Uncharacterized protein n=1 Tax=Corynespora cassiicola Philippines TaxID=1448308 RepID=A0A2T2N620_CORCC|nr:hypothetical protein BS50DRAFT_639589 [Corynespora cassiicola Philippines]
MLGLLTLSRTALVRSDDGTYANCQSYGMDFQNNGSYFQNSLSNDNFTFVTQFDNCSDDVAYNILVDPNGDQTLCSDTRLEPDDTNQLSTCPIQKSQLSSGDWSIVIISNNGDETNPVAFERDFRLSVGPQSTITYTPTATATLVSTPVVTATSTSTDTSTTVLEPSTVTSPSTTVTRTKTVTPARVTTTTTKALLTLKFTAYTINISQVTKTKTATCKTPFRQNRADPTATIMPTVGPAATIIGAKFRRQVEDQKKRFVEARAARLTARAPDPQPLIVTDANTSDWPTITTTSTAPATTATVTETTLTTTTSTPPPITVLQGKTTAPVVTVTAPTPTRTITRFNIATSVTTKTLNYVYVFPLLSVPIVSEKKTKS